MKPKSRQKTLVTTAVTAILCSSITTAGFSSNAAGEIFDMDAIRDPKTLEVKVLQDWHTVQRPIATRQKLVTINVGEMWPGQDYRVPVRMVVPADRKAKGFHLTGGNTPARLERDAEPNPLDQELLKGGVGLVLTVVQEPITGSFLMPDAEPIPTCDSCCSIHSFWLPAGSRMPKRSGNGVTKSSVCFQSSNNSPQTTTRFTSECRRSLMRPRRPSVLNIGSGTEFIHYLRVTN